VEENAAPAPVTDTVLVPIANVAVLTETLLKVVEKLPVLKLVPEPTVKPEVLVIAAVAASDPEIAVLPIAPLIVMPPELIVCDPLETKLRVALGTTAPPKVAFPYSSIAPAKVYAVVLAEALSVPIGKLALKVMVPAAPALSKTAVSWANGKLFAAGVPPLVVAQPVLEPN
jgi:hypothetical protein